MHQLVGLLLSGLLSRLGLPPINVHSGKYFHRTAKRAVSVRRKAKQRGFVYRSRAVVGAAANAAEEWLGVLLHLAFRGGTGLLAPAHAAAALHLLAKFLARFGAEVLHAPGHALLPGFATLGPITGSATPKTAEEDAGKQEQANGLRHANGWAVKEFGHEPVPECLGNEYGYGEEQRREEKKTEAAEQPEFTVHDRLMNGCANSLMC
jgi:hypothetical protein